MDTPVRDDEEPAEAPLAAETQPEVAIEPEVEELAPEVAIAEAEATASTEKAAAWQLTLPEVDVLDGADGVPLDEVVTDDDGSASEAGDEVEEEGPGPEDEHLFEIPPVEPDELDSIAASVSEEAALPELDEGTEGRRSAVPWWPYLTYIGLWLVLGVAMVVVSNRFGDPYLPESGIYPPLLLAGLVLAVLGPFTGLVGWALARRTLSRAQRVGLLSAALLRSAVFTLGGVVLWWGAFVLVDALRLGWI